MGYLWAPFVGAGISVDHVSKDFRLVEVSMKLRWYNRNIMGTHFGGSLYAMTDPFLMMMYAHHLGKDYVVWDYSASIEFKKKGLSRVKARFELEPLEIESLITRLQSQDKLTFERDVSIFDEDQQLIASVKKVLFVRRRKSRT